MCGLTLAGTGTAAPAGAAGLSLTGVSLDGTTFSSSVSLTEDWGGQVLYVAGTTADTSPPLTVTVGSQQCAAPPTLTGPSSGFDVACVLPVLPTGQTFDVTVSVGGQTATLTSALDVPPQPAVSSVSGCASNGNGSTTECPTGGGVSLELTGTGFGNEVVVLIGGQVCANLVVTSATTLTCLLPPGSGTQPVTIATGLGVVPTTLSVGYAAPLPPPAPTDVAAVPGDGTATVTWSTAADPTATAFQVTPSAGGSTLPSVTFSVPAGGAPATMSVQIAALTNGVPTTFTVAAVDGSQVGPGSTPSAPIVPSGLPSAPTGITTKKAHGQLTLSWTASGSDGGSALTGYTVTPYLGGVAQPTISVPAGATSTQPTLPKGTYVFEVSAANASGNGPASAPSAPVHIR
ncbi:MAG TPA: IPT/TIG domain-containing protein [Trebonia sp.]|nr:IPT/TIG domain-containing protein [Trebonia sp.]